MKTKSPASTVVLTDDSLCPYFEDGRISTIEYLIPDTVHMQNYHELLALGYRRSGHVFYHNVCKSCADCRPLRIEVEKFITSASQKRTLKKNSDIRVSIQSRPSLSLEKIFLYEKYVCSKHADNDNNESGDPLKVLFGLHTGYDHIIEMNYYIGKKLVAVGIVDEAADSLSSNYFYYDTDFLDRRPGVFSILQEIYLARSLGKKYYYLGFFIEKNRKMSYKKDFRPNQLFNNGDWTGFSGE